jgi:hypothetical protein
VHALRHGDRAGGAVALAREEAGRVPAPVLGEPNLHEIDDGAGILLHAPVILDLALAHGTAVARAHGIDDHHVREIEGRMLVVHDRERRRAGAPGVGGHHHALRAEEAEMQPHGGGAGPAVEHEGHGALRRILHVLGQIGGREDAGAGLAGLVAEIGLRGHGPVGHLAPAEAAGMAALEAARLGDRLLGRGCVVVLLVGHGSLRMRT